MRIELAICDMCGSTCTLNYEQLNGQLCLVLPMRWRTSDDNNDARLNNRRGRIRDYCSSHCLAVCDAAGGSP